jgi:hypothetical protein
MSGVNELLELLKHDGSNFPIPDGLDELLEWLIYDGDVLDGTHCSCWFQLLGSQAIYERQLTRSHNRLSLSRRTRC